MTDRLKDKVAIVFGGGFGEQGITNGAAAAVAYAREGAKVIAVDMNPEAARNTARMIEQEGGAAVALTGDVTSLAQIRQAVQDGLAAYGKLDILHNNVGIHKPGGPVEMEEDVWDAVLATNLKSVFLTCKEVIPAFLRNGSGAIVNISSIHGSVWLGRATIAYGSSKAAMNHLTRSIAAEYGPKNIRCNALVLGTIDTPRSVGQLSKVWAGNYETMARKRVQAVPLRRGGTPWEVANAAVFLASDEASYVTGVVMAVDGGLTCTAQYATSE